MGSDAGEVFGSVESVDGGVHESGGVVFDPLCETVVEFDEGEAVGDRNEVEVADGF